MNILTALTGFLAPRCKVYGDGFFSEKSHDPDNYFDTIHELKEKLEKLNRLARRIPSQLLKDMRLRQAMQANGVKTLEQRDGYVVIHSRYKVLEDQQQNLTIISARDSKDPMYKRTYRDKDGVRKTVEDFAIIQPRSKIANKSGFVNVVGSEISEYFKKMKAAQETNSET